MKNYIFIFSIFCLPVLAQTPSAKDVLDKIDRNMSSKNRIMTCKMIIHSKRATRTIGFKTYAEGDEQAFTEYLSPAREQGTKMLKLQNNLWIYSPETDRTIQISGNMLRESVMGSDLSYEDMMENSKLQDKYDANVSGSEKYNESDCWILELKAKVADVAYDTRKIWVDKQHFVPLKEELYAKSGKLLKKTELSDVVNIQGRWFTKKIVFKDMLKTGDGTEFIIDTIQFDQQIPDYIFSKASLKK